MKKLKDISIEFISLVKKGANGKQIILKSAEFQGEPDISKYIEIKKYDDVEGIVYGIVYSPDEIDAHEEFTDKAEIKKACYGYMKNGMQLNVDRNHDEKPAGAFVAESWITKANDSLFSDEPEGSWAVGIKLEDDALKQAVEKGEIAGISMAGTAIKEDVKKEAKTFDSAYVSANLWQVVDALAMSLRSILDDPEAKNKSEMIGASFDQCRETVLSQIKNIENDNKTEKEDGIMKKVIQKLHDLGIVKKADPEPDPPADPKPDETQDDINEMVKQGFEKITETFAQIGTRLDAIEEGMKISKQDAAPGKKKDDISKEDSLGAELASLVN